MAKGHTLSTHAVRQLTDAVRVTEGIRRQPAERSRRVSVGVGAAPAGELAEILSLVDGPPLTFSAKLVKDGAVAGDPIEVRVFAYDLDAWEDHYPPVAVGDRVPITKRDGEWWCDFWFTLTCAEGT